MKKIIRMTIAFCLVAGSAWGQAVHVGTANITDDSNRDVAIQGSYAYCANGSSGLTIIDLDDLTNSYNLDVAPVGYTCNAVAVSGNYAYCAMRKTSGAYTYGEWYNSFNEGDTNLENGVVVTGTAAGTSTATALRDSVGFDYVMRAFQYGGTIENTNQSIGPNAVTTSTNIRIYTSEDMGWDDSAGETYELKTWDGGGGTANGYSVGNETTTVFEGDYSMKTYWTADPASSWVYHTITPGTNNYAQYWIYVTRGSATNGTEQARLWVYEESGSVRCALRINDVDATHFKFDGVYSRSGGSSTATSNNTSLLYNKWYQVRINYKIANPGGMELWYRDNYGDAWTQEIDQVGVQDTSGITIDRFSMGLYLLANTWTSGAVYFDEVFLDLDDDGNVMEDADDDGLLSVVDVTDPTNPSELGTIYVEQKLSGAYIDGNYLYCGSQVRGLTIFDVSTPADPQYVSSYNKYKVGGGVDPADYDAHGTTKSGDYVYQPIGQNGFMIIDVSTVTAPSAVAWLDQADSPYLNMRAWDAEINGNYLYLSNNCDDNIKVPLGDGSADYSGIWVVDVTTKSAPVTAGHGVLQTIGGVDHKDNLGGSALDTNPQMLDYSGGYVYVSNGTKGIAVFSVSDPTNPTHIYSVTPSGTINISGVAVSNNVFVGVSYPADIVATGDLYKYQLVWGGGTSLGLDLGL